eukprot:g3033.t1
MLAKRFATTNPMREPPYEIEKVPYCEKDMKGSVLRKVTDRKEWEDSLAEMLLLCNEAVRRSAARRREKGLPPIVTPDHPVPDGKPITLEYIADRLDIDDPIWGYQIRTEKEGWLQGFVLVTNFTCWHRWFHWTSLAMEAEVFRVPHGETDIDRTWREARVRDVDGSLAKALDRQMRDGDINTEGVIFPHVAEISLLGGLRCGSRLVREVVRELEKPTSLYEFIVIHATDNAIPFYERNGFVHVGAVAKHERKRNKTDGCELLPSSSSSSSSTSGVRSPRKPAPVDAQHGYVSYNVETYRTVKDDETPRDVAREVGVDVRDVLWLNRGMSGLHETAKLYAGTKVRVPHNRIVARSFSSSSATYGGGGKADMTTPMASMPTPTTVATPSSLSSSSSTTRSRRRLCNNEDGGDDKAGDGNGEVTRRKTIMRGILDRLAFTDVHDYFARPVTRRDAPDYFRLIEYPMDFSTIQRRIPKIAQRPPSLKEEKSAALPFAEFERLVMLVVTNARQYNKELSPVFRAANKVERTLCCLLSIAREHVPAKSSSSNALGRLFRISSFVLAEDNETPAQIAGRVGVPATAVLEMNVRRIEGLKRNSKLIESTQIFVPPLPGLSSGWIGEEGEKGRPRGNTDALTLAYRHWTTGNDPYEESVKSYMMALCLKRGDRVVLSSTPKRGGVAVSSSSSIQSRRPTILRTRRAMGAPVTPRAPYQYAPPHPDSMTVERRKLSVRVRGVDGRAAQAALKASWRGFRCPSEKLTCQGKYKAYGERRMPEKLFNSIVTLYDEGCPRARNHEYFYVLTYVPDLQFARVVPVVQDGVFGPERRTYGGRPRYRLVPEDTNAGSAEMDVSAWRCWKVQSRAVKHVPDADDEEWDIGPPPKPTRTGVPSYLSSGRGRGATRRAAKGGEDEDGESTPKTPPLEEYLRAKEQVEQMEVEEGDDDDDDTRTTGRGIGDHGNESDESAYQPEDNAEEDGSDSEFLP